MEITIFFLYVTAPILLNTSGTSYVGIRYKHAYTHRVHIKLVGESPIICTRACYFNGMVSRWKFPEGSTPTKIQIIYNTTIIVSKVFYIT